MAGLEKAAELNWALMLDPTKLTQQRASRAYEDVPDNLDKMNSTRDVRERLGGLASLWRILGSAALGTGAGAIAGVNISNKSGDGNNAVPGAVIGGLLGGGLGWLADNRRRKQVYNDAVADGLVADPTEAAQLFGTTGPTWQEKYDKAKRRERGF